MSHTPPNDIEELPDDLGELLEESLPLLVDQRAIPVDLNTLFPWHRPRKQKVREQQWMGLAQQYLEQLLAKGALRAAGLDQEEEGPAPEVRYLTLPGLDYLDVRLLGDVCRQLGLKLTSLGFLDGEDQTRVLARARVREVGLVESGLITDKSITIPRKIESICARDGDSLSDLKRRAPFHIINIDACGSVAPPGALHSSRLVDAVYRLVELQLSRATDRWLFFFTVDVRDGDMDEGTFASLCEAIRLNAAASDDFAAAAKDLFSQDAASLDAAMVEARGDGGQGMLNLFSLGFAKWLLHLAQDKLWTVKMKRSHCYSTRGGNESPPTMCSLAFEFVPPPPGLEDRLGVTRQRPMPGGNQQDPSMQIVTAAAAIDNLDEVFAREPELAAAMNARTRELLLEAGYHADALAPLLPQETDQGISYRKFPDVPIEPG